LKEESVKKEQDEITSKYCKKYPLSVQIDWASVIKASDRGYVKEVRSVGDLARFIMMDSCGTQFGNQKGVEIALLHSGLLNRYECFEITFVPEQVNFNPGHTKTLQPTAYKTSSKGNKFILICSRHHNNSAWGPGLTLEWALNPAAAKQREDAEVKRLAMIYKDDCVDERNSTIKRHNDECTRISKNYQDDVKKWQKACEKTNARNNEACHWCRGSGIVACGSNCGGSKCRTCGGSKKKSCTWSHCPKHYSSEKMPSQPREPRQPSAPTFKDLSSVVESYINSL